MKLKMHYMYKHPQSIIYADGQYFHCLQCRGHQFEYGGQVEHEGIHDGGELDGEPLYWYSDLYRCIGCQVVIEVSEDTFPGYKGPEINPDYPENLPNTNPCAICGEAHYTERCSYHPRG